MELCSISVLDDSGEKSQDLVTGSLALTFKFRLPMKRALRSGGGAEFDWTEAESRTEIVNEAFFCNKLNVDVRIC